MDGRRRLRKSYPVRYPPSKISLFLAESAAPPMMHGHEKSRSAIVAVKPTNKVVRPAAEQSAVEPAAAEPVEPRAEAEGKAGQQRTHRAQYRVRDGRFTGLCETRHCRVSARSAPVSRRMEKPPRFSPFAAH